MNSTTKRTARTVLIRLFAVSAGVATGCGSEFSVSLRPQPTDCFRQDVIDTGCFTRESVVTFCEEDFFGFLQCIDDVVVDVVCEDVVVDSFLVCE